MVTFGMTWNFKSNFATKIEKQFGRRWFLVAFDGLGKVFVEAEGPSLDDDQNVEQGRGQDPHDGDNERAKAPDAVRAAIVSVAAEETESAQHDKQINAGQQETDQRHYHHGQKQFFAVELDRHDTQDANKEGRDRIARTRNRRALVSLLSVATALLEAADHQGQERERQLDDA